MKLASRLFILALLCGTYAYANPVTVKPMNFCASCGWGNGCCIASGNGATCKGGVCNSGQ
jgi:hypothetical protein